MDEIFQEYEATLARITEQAHKATEEARATLQEQLTLLQPTRIVSLIPPWLVEWEKEQKQEK